MLKFNNCEEIKEHFIKNGWNKEIKFEEIGIEDTGVTPLEKYKNKRYFRMKNTGNIFDENGKIFLYNIKPLETIPA